MRPDYNLAMRSLPQLFENNQQWAREQTAKDPEFFQRLSKQQDPDVLWIGCADSRVPANQIIGLAPGDVFVHRNIANIVVHTDFNCLSVIEFAVSVLRVRHIIVCGHYGCGGVHAASQDSCFGLVDNWLRHIRDVREKHGKVLAAIDDPDRRLRRLCELNVVEQAQNVCYTTAVQSAWSGGADLCVHGWIYDVEDGLLRDLEVTVSVPEELPESYRMATC